MSQHVKISLVAARWLIEYATQLVNDGFGVRFDPRDPVQSIENSEFPGFIDEIPMENGQLWRYMNAVIAFARTVAAILARNMAHPSDDFLIAEDISILEEME